MSRYDKPLGHIEKVEHDIETGNLIASGGFCAPAELLYNMGLGEALTPEEIAALPDPEPDRLPEITTEYTERTVYVLHPTSDYYGTEERYDTLGAAILAFGKRRASSSTYEGIWVEEWIERSRILIADHGLLEPQEGDGGFPTISVNRGGITYERESNQ